MYKICFQFQIFNNKSKCQISESENVSIPSFSVPIFCIFLNYVFEISKPKFSSSAIGFSKKKSFSHSNECLLILLKEDNIVISLLLPYILNDYETQNVGQIFKLKIIVRKHYFMVHDGKFLTISDNER